MKVYDYRIVEKLNLGTMKPYFIIQKYNLTTQEYNLHSNAVIQTLEYFLTETAADMDGLSWEIREETNFEDNNIEHLTECYDFNKELYDNLKQIKSIIEEVK